MPMRFARPWKNSHSSTTSLPSGGSTMRGVYWAQGRGKPMPSVKYLRASAAWVMPGVSRVSRGAIT